MFFLTICNTNNCRVTEEQKWIVSHQHTEEKCGPDRFSRSFFCLPTLCWLLLRPHGELMIKAGAAGGSQTWVQIPAPPHDCRALKAPWTQVSWSQSQMWGLGPITTVGIPESQHGVDVQEQKFLTLPSSLSPYLGIVPLCMVLVLGFHFVLPTPSLIGI